ncbi:MAG TPA: recombinase family protein [Rhizomicrobium sp.]|nr:recombinase family protein [Rhizomicrobium sp.]
MAETRKLSRCAIYTRKSTEHNLDLEFNSLDAQREACEAYIRSQAQEGWRLVPGEFNDGGISGVSLDRPALQALLSEIQAGKVDVVVVYKVDRLTRSLADFAKLVELFDQHGVSFVSITQSFNTTTSMGRLTLNVLLSFAQFEREVIGERVRDKISASKRKGIWMGGPVPLGYASVNKKIVVVPEEAETVRQIFRRYLELGSVRLLAADLDKRGIKSKVRALSGGRTSGGGRFGVGALSHFLKNRVYIGEIFYHGEIHAGEHEPILDRSLFQQVQEKLSNNNVERQLKLKSSRSILAGRTFDDRGNRMLPTHTVKNGVRYRYYVSSAIQQKRDGDVGSVSRVPAPEIETLVIQAVRGFCEKGPTTAESSNGDFLSRLTRVVITPTGIKVHVSELPSPSVAEGPTHDNLSLEPTVLTVQWEPSKFVAVKGIIRTPSETAPGLKPESRDVILRAIAKSRLWLDELVRDQASIAEIAKREGKIERHLRLLLPLAFVSPGMVKAIANGSAPTHLTVTGLAKRVPLSWNQP